MNYFDEFGYTVKRNVLSIDALKILESQFKTIRTIHHYKSGIPLSEPSSLLTDKQSSFNTYSKGYKTTFDYILPVLQPIIEKTIEKALIPTYAFGRIYYAGSLLYRHSDRQACEISMSLCVSSSEDYPWPIWITDKTGVNKSVNLNPGDAIIYNGYLPHWRDAYDGKEQIQLFCHFVDANGAYGDCKYDQRPVLGIEYTDEQIELARKSGYD